MRITPGNRPGESVFWLNDVPAVDAGLPACGHDPNQWYPNGCTRAAGHDGDHGHPNWSGRLTAQAQPGSLEIATRDSHQFGSAVIHDREDGLLLLGFLRWKLDQAFDEDLPGSDVVIEPDTPQTLAWAAEAEDGYDPASITPTTPLTADQHAHLRRAGAVTTGKLLWGLDPQEHDNDPGKAVAIRPQDPSPFEDAAYMAGLRAGFHEAWVAVRRTGTWRDGHAVIAAAMRHGLTGEDVTWQ